MENRIIVSTAKENISEFQNIMFETDKFLNADALKRKPYYKSRTATELEYDVFVALKECAKGTVFENTFELISGKHFPDIIANKFFGVEVKSTEKDHWFSTGGSILETTRNKDVEKIYMTFGKMGGNPIEFLSKPYAQCLSEIAVTHSPRYKIDMKIQEKNEKTIFEKMGVDYDYFRKNNPISITQKYYKSQLKSGESLWWIGDENPYEKTVPITLRIWNTLSSNEKKIICAECFALFPEIFASDFNRVALWLTTHKNIVNPHIRDMFSAGGQKEIITQNGVLLRMPAVFFKIQQHSELIKQIIEKTEKETLTEYWQEKIQNDRINQFCKLIVKQVRNVDTELAFDILKYIFQAP